MTPGEEMRKKIQIFMNKGLSWPKSRNSILVVNDNSLECERICKEILKNEASSIIFGCTSIQYIEQLQKDVKFTDTIYDSNTLSI